MKISRASRYTMGASARSVGRGSVAAYGRRPDRRVPRLPRASSSSGPEHRAFTPESWVRVPGGAWRPALRRGCAVQILKRLGHAVVPIAVRGLDAVAVQRRRTAGLEPPEEDAAGLCDE